MKGRIISTLILRPCHIFSVLTYIPNNMLHFSSKACNNLSTAQGLLIQAWCCSRLFVLKGFTPHQFSGTQEALEMWSFAQGNAVLETNSQFPRHFTSIFPLCISETV